MPTLCILNTAERAAQVDHKVTLSLKEPCASAKTRPDSLRASSSMLSKVRFSTISNLVTKWRIITHYDLKLKIRYLRGRSKKGNPGVRIYVSNSIQSFNSNTNHPLIRLGHMDMRAHWHLSI